MRQYRGFVAGPSLAAFPMGCGSEPACHSCQVVLSGLEELGAVLAMLAMLAMLVCGCQLSAVSGWHGARLVRTLVGGAPSRGRFGCEASSMARSSVAAGGAAGGEGSGARSMTLSVY